ncbi:MAG: lysylphosphatidylglycerol synthase transmembrane domain-containing protein [Candidatus ainarchaeum sp.]|nr:lysylphosphatidylglycerol synthase transmembrane domain-containing protein [Candidatus ainarchaeum sp.]
MRSRNFLFLIGVALFAAILLFLGPEGSAGIAATISRADPVIFAFAIILIAPCVFLKGLKQQLLLVPFGKKISLVESMEVWLAGYLLGAVSPGRSGDFLRSVYFKKNFGIKTGSGLSAVMVERVLDMGFLLIAGILGFVYFSVVFEMPRGIILALCAALALFAALFFLILRKKTALGIGRKFFRLVPHSLKGRARQGFHDFFDGISGYKTAKKIIFFSVLITVASWILFFFQVLLLAGSLHIGISFAAVSAMIPITSLAEIIPTVFGIGARDFTLMGLFAAFGLSTEAAVSLSLLILLVELIQSFFGVLFIRKLKKPGF